MEEAERHYFGTDGYLQDYAEAFKRFRDAARLGSPKAYRRLGDMYLDGEGVREDCKKALEFYKEGVKKQNHFCYAGMTALFLRNSNLENASKALAKFIECGARDSWDQEEFRDEHLVRLIWTLVSVLGTFPRDIETFVRIVQPYIPDVLKKIDQDSQNPRIQERIKEKQQMVADALRHLTP